MYLGITSIGDKTYTRQGEKAHNSVFMRGTSPPAYKTHEMHTVFQSFPEKCNT